MRFLILIFVLLIPINSLAGPPGAPPQTAGAGSGDIEGVLDDATGAVPVLYQAATAFSAQDTTPSVAGHSFFETNNSSSTRITDFDDPTAGQWISLLINDTHTSFDFTSSNLEGIAADFNGTDGEMLTFYYGADTKWHANTSPEALETLSTDGIVVNSSGTPLAVTNNVVSANYTIGTDSLAECYGGVIFADTNGTVVTGCDDLANGMSWTVKTVGAVTVHGDVQSDDKQYLDGVLLDDGDKATNTATTGDLWHCSYYSAIGVDCVSGSPDGDHWTDGS